MRVFDAPAGAAVLFAIILASSRKAQCLATVSREQDGSTNIRRIGMSIALYDT